MRDAAMSSIARVIFFVDCTERMRRRYSRSFAPNELLRARDVRRRGRLGGVVAFAPCLAVVVLLAALGGDLLLALLAFAHGLGGVLLLSDRVTRRRLELL